MGERIEQVMDVGRGGSMLVHIGTNNSKREGMTANSDETAESTQEDEAIEGWADHFSMNYARDRGQGYRNARRMAINALLYSVTCSMQLCEEDKV